MNSYQRILRIALVGLGNQGQKHLNSIITLEGEKMVKLVGLCDIFDKEYSSTIKVPFYFNYKKLYSELNPDIVIIATPNHLHKQMTLNALNKKIHVIKEKPFAINYSDAEELIKVSRKNMKLIVTTQQRFYSPTFLNAKTIIPSLGKIISFSYRFTLNDNVKSWRWDLKKAGGGSWLNMGWHAVSIIQWLIGKIETVELHWKIGNKRPWTYQTDHSSSARIIVENNIIGSVFLSCVYPKKEELLKLVFSEGILYLSRNNLKFKSFKEKSMRHIFNLHRSSKENEIYTAQLKGLLKMIQKNSYDEINDLSSMAVIQAGTQSAYSNSSSIQVKEFTKSSSTIRIK